MYSLFTAEPKDLYNPQSQSACLVYDNVHSYHSSSL